MRIPLCLAFLALAGCSFSRVMVNGHVRGMETSWIEPGRTTKEDVIARMGRPPSVFGVAGDGMSRYYAECLALRPKGIDARDEDVDGPEMNAFRWCSADTYDGTFEGGHWIIPTFSRSHIHRSYDILILFDKADVVSLLCRTATVDGKVRILEWKEPK